MLIMSFSDTAWALYLTEMKIEDEENAVEY
jgi:hypothetical protein